MDRQSLVAQGGGDERSAVRGCKGWCALGLCDSLKLLQRRVFADGIGEHGRALVVGANVVAKIERQQRGVVANAIGQKADTQVRDVLVLGQAVFLKEEVGGALGDGR